MFHRWWTRTIILLLSLFLFVLGFYIIAVRVGNNGIGFVSILFGFVLFRVYTFAVKKAKISKDELFIEKARRGQR